ncbi:MAG: 23S rRNA (uracil(1939)-C(5))-methyltransferase RlmD [Synechococcaceae cyanobacterium ELA182]
MTELNAAATEVELEIQDLSHDGRGIGRLDGRVVFVDGALPGDRVVARLLPQRRRQLHADLRRILQPSPQRRRAPCILADHCGGCSLQPFTDEGQQQWKQRSLEQSLQRIAGLNPEVRPLLTSDRPLGYRNRAVIPLERGEDGHLKAGYYRRGSHRIVNMNRCPVLDPRIDRLIAPLKRDLETSDWPVDRHGLSEGGLKHLALRVGHHTGEVLITLIASHQEFEGLTAMAESWLERWPEVVGVSLNLQPRPTNQLFGRHTLTLAGRGWLSETFAGLDYRIGADTFFQVHTTQAERLVPLLLQGLAAAQDQTTSPDQGNSSAQEPNPASPSGSGVVLDAFCGIGTFSLPLAAAGWTVHGIEQHAPAVELARLNAEGNDLSDRATFETSTVAIALPALLDSAEALLLDPPRKGLEAPVLAAILACPPRRLLYLSCDPATLSRDLGLLCAEVYTTRSVQPIDFFPNTSHIEALAVLDRRD